MLINVFKHWINPERIAYLEELKLQDTVQVRVVFIADSLAGSMKIYGQSSASVAAEINRQIKGE